MARSLWFRVYTKIVRSKKIQSLNPELFRFLINLWAVAKESDGILPEIDELAWLLHVRRETAEKWISQLISKSLLDEIDGKLVPHDWDEHQFESDSSTERVRALRKRRCNVASEKVERSMKQPCNAPRARATEQSRADTEQNPQTPFTDEAPADPPPPTLPSGGSVPRKEIEALTARMRSRHPGTRKGGRGEVAKRLEAIWRKTKAGEREGILALVEKNHESMCGCRDWTKDGGAFAPGLPVWLNPANERYLDAAPSSVNGTGKPAEQPNSYMDHEEYQRMKVKWDAESRERREAERRSKEAAKEANEALGLF